LSGSGKSTLLRAANGLNLVTRGQVLVGDGDTIVDIGVTCDPATLRRIRRLRVAMVFQQFGLLPWRTVRDNVGLGLELRGDSPDKRRRIIDQQLELVGLSQWGERYCSELSGACSSAWDWRAPWPPMRTSCSWTSRSRRSIP